MLVLVVHHIAADGWSMAPLARDLIAAYGARSRGRGPGLGAAAGRSTPTTRCGSARCSATDDDPSRWRRSSSPTGADTLAGAARAARAAHRPPAPGRAVVRGAARSTVEIDADLHARLAGLARGTTAPRCSWCCTPRFAVLLARLSGSDDIAVGTPVAGSRRPAPSTTWSACSSTPWCCAPTRPAARVRRSARPGPRDDLAAFGHADVPFERLVEALGPGASPAHTPLFQVMLSFQNNRTGRSNCPG